MKRQSKVRKVPNQSSSNAAKSSPMKLISKHFTMIVIAVIVLTIAILGAVIYSRSGSVIKNLINADIEQLKSVFFGETPYLFFCDREGKSQNLPKSFTDLNMIKGSKMGFATVNCSQLLPSGRSVWERFHLKKEWRPTIFGTAPWMKPLQAGPTYLKDVKGLTKFVDNAMAPKGTEISTDKDLIKFCNFEKNVVLDETMITDTCLVIMKGSRFSKNHAELEKNLILSYPHVSTAVVDAKKRRLSFEDVDELPYDSFAMKIHALRNGTHFMSMVNPITWDYIDTFVAHAVGVPLYEFAKDANPIKFIKPTKTVEKPKKPTKVPSSNYNKPDGAPRVRPIKTESDTMKTENENVKTENEKVEPEPVIMTPEELEAARIAAAAEKLQRERQKREEMERMAQENFFQSAEEESMEGSEEDSEEEDVIEL